MRHDGDRRPSPILIRRAVAADIETLRNFERGIVAAERPFDPTIIPGDVSYYDLPALVASDDAFVAIAESGGAPAGCGFARRAASRAFTEPAHHAYVGLLYVAPPHRGQGTARMIIERLSEWALENGLVEMRLEVYPENAKAVRAYGRAGFSPYMLEMRRRLKD